jgi:hypothetical protein
MSVVIDEALAAEKFTARLTAYSENVFAFDCRAASIVSCRMFEPLWETSLAKSRQEAEFAWIHFL